MQYHLKNLEIPATIGVYDSEKDGPQTLLVNVYFVFEAEKAPQTDDLADTIDYAEIESLVRKVCVAQHYQLLEKLHPELILTIKNEFPDLKNLEVHLEKFPFKSGSIVLK